MLADLMIKLSLASRFMELRAKILMATGSDTGRGGYVGGPSGHAEDKQDLNVDLSA